MAVIHAVAAGLLQSLAFFWESLFGLVFGFLVSAIVQVVLTPRDMDRYLGGNARGLLYATGFGIISSACSYGAAAAARGFYQRGADLRSVFAFLISSTNMNLAILILFWSLLGWRFAFAEFFGGIIIIAVVVAGLSIVFRSGQPRYEQTGAAPALVTECPLCGMEGEPDLAVPYQGGMALACGNKHFKELSNPAPAQRPSLGSAQTWRAVAEAAIGDVQMLRGELAIGYLIAGFAAALVPPQWLANVLHAVGSVPFAGGLLLLLVGLLLAVITFICSMGNVPVARFLAGAGIPLSANTAFIYGDLLIPPLVAIYNKSFPRRVTVAFVALFTVGALVAGAVMGAVIGDFGGTSMGSMALNDRITLVTNVVALAAVAALAIVVRRADSPAHAS
ncbi:MAG TPA: permease [Candidatus Baltobacteraceae bacterium]|nr:permease [Candidatus Baltobacteraceae bacterium]